MSRDAKIELAWADGDYTFRLGFGELSELQELCDAGPYVVLDRLRSGRWRVEDLTGVVRLGLIGAGMTPADALKKVRAYVEARPPMETVTLAYAILNSALVGAPDEKVGEAQGETEIAQPDSPTES